MGNYGTIDYLKLINFH